MLINNLFASYTQHIYIYVYIYIYIHSVCEAKQNARLRLSRHCTQIVQIRMNAVKHIMVRTFSLKTLIIAALYALFDAPISAGNAALCFSPGTSEELLWCSRTWH